MSQSGEEWYTPISQKTHPNNNIVQDTLKYIYSFFIK